MDTGPHCELELRSAASSPALYRRLGAAALVLAVVGTGIIFALRAFRADERPPRPNSTVENGEIAFVATGYGNSRYEIYTVDPDGSDLRKLADGRDPAWSPDGRRLAFTIDQPGLGIGLLNADGTGLTELTPDVAYAQSPGWSPDGTRIAFAGQDGIYVMNSDGTDVRRIVDRTARVR